MKHHLRVVALLSAPALGAVLVTGIDILGHFVNVMALEVERENHRRREERRRELEARRKAGVPAWMQELREVRK